MIYDFIVVGAGIVGVAACRELLLRRPDAKILLLEKESGPGYHQTGHNSGVVHAGVYYEPGSMKAQFCREGLTATGEYCRQNNLPFERSGKLLASVVPEGRGRVRVLFRGERGRAADNRRSGHPIGNSYIAAGIVESKDVGVDGRRGRQANPDEQEEQWRF